MLYPLSYGGISSIIIGGGPAPRKPSRRPVMSGRAGSSLRIGRDVRVGHALTRIPPPDNNRTDG